MALVNQPSTNDASTATPRRLLLISVPRTASNLLLKILNIHNQPSFLTSTKGGYFFYPAFVLAAQRDQLTKSAERWTVEEKQALQSTFQCCFDTLEEYSVRALDEHKAVFAKEHASWLSSPAAFQKMMTGHTDTDFAKSFRVQIPEKYGTTQTYSMSNETILSDQYLRSWQLAFIIRHPAVTWPSMYRALTKVAAEGFMDEGGLDGALRTNMSLHWARKLYDWCIEQPDMPTPPPVIDAHDLIHSPEVVLKLCEQTGLDKSVLQFEWNDQDAEKKSSQWAAPSPDASAQEQDLHRRVASIMLSTIEGSTGILKDKSPSNIDIGAETEKWIAEFGEEVARFIEKAVWDAMSDYEYLKARRITGL